MGAGLASALPARRRGESWPEWRTPSVADVALATVHAAESDVVCSLETYLRLAGALSLRTEFDLADPHRREPSTRRAQEPVHAAMGEVEASHLRAIGFRVGIDEPFQHYQFAGRADVVAWSVECEALLHIENRTRFPDIQESFGSFNAKRRYLGADLAARLVSLVDAAKPT